MKLFEGPENIIRIFSWFLFIFHLNICVYYYIFLKEYISSLFSLPCNKTRVNISLIAAYLFQLRKIFHLLCDRYVLVWINFNIFIHASQPLIYTVRHNILIRTRRKKMKIESSRTNSDGCRVSSLDEVHSNKLNWITLYIQLNYFYDKAWCYSVSIPHNKVNRFGIIILYFYKLHVATHWNIAQFKLYTEIQQQQQQQYIFIVCKLIEFIWHEKKVKLKTSTILTIIIIKWHVWFVSISWFRRL